MRDLLDRIWMKMLDVYDWWRFLDPQPRYILLFIAVVILIGLLRAILRVIF